MIEKIIIPDFITRKESVSGKEFLSVEGKDGELYQVWNPKIFRGFVGHKPIRVRIRRVRDFNNVVGIVGKKVEAKELKEIKESKRADFDARARGMARGACFNNACAIVIALYTKRDMKEKDILPLIKKYFGELQKILTE